MAKLTVSIVNYNGGEYLIKCLESLEKIKEEVSMEIWVVDNNSTDDSIKTAEKKFPKVSFIKNKLNVGFSKANNQILEKAKSEYILILNPDTEVKKGILGEMIKYMEENEEVGAATGEIILSNGKVDLTAHRGFPTPWASFKYYFLKDDSLYHLSKLNMKEPHEVEAISGAFFLTKKEVLDRVGYFDEDYFMYGEDLDLCFRIINAGYKIMYLPEFSILHHKGVTSGLKKHSKDISTASSETKKRAFDAFYQSMKIFYKKNLEGRYPFFIDWIVYLGIDLKWALARRKMNV